jgi:histone deacetylase 4/5
MDHLSKVLPRQAVDLMAMAAVAATERTGLGYDAQMLLHRCSCQNDAFHPENPLRLITIWERLVATGLAAACVHVARKATLEEIQSHHSEEYTLMYGLDTAQRSALGESGKKPKLCQLSCGGTGIDADTYWNEVETPAALRTAVGSLIELSQKVKQMSTERVFALRLTTVTVNTRLYFIAGFKVDLRLLQVLRGDLRNGFALIRPPSHHAEYEEAMGFCYFNAVAIAAKQLQLIPGAARRILIIDWAIHHGNGTQKAFYDNPNVLYISLHRHDNGNFYPGTGSSVECGTAAGIGFNINIAWSGGLEPPMGDAEYLAAFRSIIMPVARSFDPDLVLVSAGFDAATRSRPPASRT